MKTRKGTTQRDTLHPHSVTIFIKIIQGYENIQINKNIIKSCLKELINVVNIDVCVRYRIKSLK